MLNQRHTVPVFSYQWQMDLAVDIQYRRTDSTYSQRPYAI